MSRSTTESRWLVTGAAGFLGSHVVDELLASGQPVAALDNLHWGREDNIARHAHNSCFRFVNADVRDGVAIGEAMARFKPNCVVHLAALHYIPAAEADPALTVSINVHGTQVMLSAALKAGVQRFWYASTGDVYPPSDAAHREEDAPGPFNIYGLSKLQGEQLVALAARQHPQTHFVAGRLFNLYGPGETNPHILPGILRQLRNGPSAPLRLGSLWPERDLTPVRDAACVVIETMRRSKPGITTINIGSSKASSIRTVLDLLAEILARPVAVETDPDKVRRVERPHLQADVSRLKAMLGWTPHGDLRRGLCELLTSEMS
jgi:UDP-glucose 4-epimerase